MGGDGGTTNASRADLVKLRKAPERIDKETVNAMRWTLCGLSQEPLNSRSSKTQTEGASDTVVADGMGNLFNRSAVIEYLLSKIVQPKFAHIKSLKDVWSVRLTYPDDSKSISSAAATATALPAAATEIGAPKKQTAPPVRDAAHMTGADRAVSGTGGRVFICPITSAPANGRHPFIVKRVCGCVYSKKAVLEVPSDTCLLCGRALPQDLKEREAENIPLLSDSMQELERLKTALAAAKALAAANKKAAKSKTAGSAAAAAATDSNAQTKTNSSAAADTKTSSAASAAAATDSGSGSGGGGDAPKKRKAGAAALDSDKSAPTKPSAPVKDKSTAIKSAATKDIATAKKLKSYDRFASHFVECICVCVTDSIGLCFVI